MRAIQLSIVFLFLSHAAARGAEGMQWHHDLESAKRAAAHLKRPILLHFWSPACMPCVKLEQEVYSRPEVKRALESMFVLVKLNVDDYPATAANYGVKSWPADVILSADGQFVSLLKCESAPQQYLAQREHFIRDMNARAVDRSSLAGTGTGSAWGGPNGMLPQASIVQTSVQEPARNQPTASASTGAYVGSAAASQIATYDFRGAGFRGAGGTTQSAANSVVNQPGVQASSAQYGQPSQQSSPASQQPILSYSQQPLAQQMEMVPATAAPPIGLDGYCPVQLNRVRNYGPNDPRFKYTQGDPRYGVVHRGRTYLFSGPAEQQEFLRDPDRYSPAMSGMDPVMLFDANSLVPGDRQFGAYYGDRVYLFASKRSLDTFLAENEQARLASRANRYAEAIYQAENPGRGMMR